MKQIILLTLLTLTSSCAKAQPDQANNTATLTAEIITETTPEIEPAIEQSSDLSKSKPTLRQQSVKRVELHVESPEINVIPEATEMLLAANTPEQHIAATEDISAKKQEGSESTPVTEPAVTSGELFSLSAATEAALFDGEAQKNVDKLLKKGKMERERKHFLPTRQRIDREINKIKFAYKGEIMMGLTASYGTLSSDDTDYMLILDNIDASGTVATVKPFIGYFYRDNNCIGVRFGYRHVGGSVNDLKFDLGETNDMSMDIPYLDMSSDNYSFGIFHRSYAGLDPKGRFGLFAEFELSLSTGSSQFAYESNKEIKKTFSDNTQVKLMFNPGAAVYIFPNVCATLSFGLGGIQYTSVTQKDEFGNKTGSRKSSSMKFKLNIAAINIGMTIHLWDKKKE